VPPGGFGGDATRGWTVYEGCLGAHFQSRLGLPGHEFLARKSTSNVGCDMGWTQSAGP
jgi:hypothetical protein